ncbi:MAG: hypothetical protein M3179_07350 [Actinomycetota bacterium]|nr:hypothetical protein [Actinomycetota bacterium]
MLVVGELDGVLGEKGGRPSLVGRSTSGEDRLLLPLPTRSGGHWWRTAARRPARRAALLAGQGAQQRRRRRTRRARGRGRAERTGI